ncbi:unnamed protein product [Rotaria sordida]|uniref:Uncharacterized protein n=1 Tax=Rotaria sordida TaxID=392033 RepID=A0A819DCZ2_9BILA|nr:unnamed protein product [Rotaria sordida]CAF1396009.1 unnamed protein product [Rotaria sordida]CAF3836221.1 unnamed protein product [Rotaria sordida]CAF4126055.1 unnamed protein product [Rotaria sordida]
MNLCAQQINSVNKIVFGVVGVSPLASILSIPQQSTFDYFHLVLEIHFRYLLSEWCNVLKQNTLALNFINDCLDEISYPHTFHRRPLNFTNCIKWKASQLRCFMIYTALPLLVKLCLNVSNCFPQVYISYFVLLFIYIRLLRHFDDRDEIRKMSRHIHSYLNYFSSISDPCKELLSVHVLVHLWQQVQQHGGLAYHRQVSYLCNTYTEKYRQEFDLIYNQTFGEFSNLSLKYYSRYQCGLIVYHSISYNRRQNSNSYTVCVKDEKVEFETEHD